MNRGGIATEVHRLKAEEELRIEVDWNCEVDLQLLKGKAEVFGTELPKRKVFTIRSCKIALFTWHGAEIEIKGSYHSYVANETPMGMYANAHAIIDKRRKEARLVGDPGPRVLVCGPTDTGKSSLCKILLGYAARQDRKVIFADLDIGQNSITIPGMLAAIHADRPYCIEEGFSKRAPLVYFYGHDNLDINIECYNNQVEKLFSQIEAAAQTDAEIQSSGIIINTPGWVTGKGFDILQDTIRKTKADIVIVLDNERLYSDLNKNLKNQKIDVVKLPKSGGVVTRPSDFRRNTRKDTIRQYFYGPKRDLSPRVITLGWHDVALYRIGASFQVPSCALPIGAESVQDPVSLELINPSSDLEHTMAAVSYSQDENTLLEHNIAGYIHIKSVLVERRKLVLLVPCSFKLPSRYLLVGDIKWMDSA